MAAIAERAKQSALIRLILLGNDRAVPPSQEFERENFKTIDRFWDIRIEHKIEKIKNSKLEISLFPNFQFRNQRLR